MGRARFDPGYDNRRPWNAGRLVGAKRPFKVKQISTIRFHLDHEQRLRDRALLDLAIDSKLRRCDPSGHLSTQQYARLVDKWVTVIGLRPQDYGTHSLRRTKASLIYKQTGNLLAVQILLGHTKIETTVRYPGVDVEDTLILTEGVEI